MNVLTLRFEILQRSGHVTSHDSAANHDVHHAVDIALQVRCTARVLLTKKGPKHAAVEGGEVCCGSDALADRRGQGGRGREARTAAQHGDADAERLQHHDWRPF